MVIGNKKGSKLKAAIKHLDQFMVERAARGEEVPPSTKLAEWRTRMVANQAKVLRSGPKSRRGIR